MAASMSVEAAVVLPIFIFFFVNLSCAIEMMRLHGNIETALVNAGNKLSVYGSVYSYNGGYVTAEEGDDDGIMDEIKDVAFSYAYIKNEVIDYTGKAYLDASPLLYGSDGLNFLESEIFTSGDTFEITMTYAVQPWIKMPGVRPFRMANRYYGHIWNGYGTGFEGQAPEEAVETVYVAENASVYHENRNCTHLSLRISEVNTFDIPGLRNENGGKYTACEKCAKGLTPYTLYIGAEGDRYHFDRNCPGLKRTVYSMTKAEAVKKYRPCSRCSA
ncbi:MAG: hypothetical protein IJ608_11435 [Lachnospiraceae bacterium]|nr:hypothetical protein [Lachnospiraceae bacterium]